MGLSPSTKKNFVQSNFQRPSHRAYRANTCNDLSQRQTPQLLVFRAGYGNTPPFARSHQADFKRQMLNIHLLFSFANRLCTEKRWPLGGIRVHPKIAQPPDSGKTPFRHCLWRVPFKERHFSRFRLVFSQMAKGMQIAPSTRASVCPIRIRESPLCAPSEATTPGRHATVFAPLAVFDKHRHQDGMAILLFEEER